MTPPSPKELKLIKKLLKSSRFVEIKIRHDGKWHVFDADWLKDLIEKL